MAEKIKAPTWLDKIAKDLFNQLSLEIELNKGQIQCLAILCQSFSQYRAATEKIIKEGTRIHSDRGWKTNPELKNQAQSYEMFLKMAKALGITKQIETIEEVDELGDFISDN